MLLAATALALQAAPDAPERSTVAVARADTIMNTESPLAIGWLYPEGRIDYGVIERLLGRAVAGAAGAETVDDAWKALLSPGDRVGIQVDVEGVQPHDPILEALIRQIMDSGVPMRNIIIFAGEESALFRAGYDISGRAPGVRVMAGDKEGYRKGLTRIVLDHATKIVNLSRLRVDPEIGMYGALANSLASVSYVDRKRMLDNPVQLPEAAARATTRRKTVLHIIDALRPGISAQDGGGRFDTCAYDGVMASTDPVALDVIAGSKLQSMIVEEAGGGACPELEVPYLLPAAEAYRLGVADIEQIDLMEIGP